MATKQAEKTTKQHQLYLLPLYYHIHYTTITQTVILVNIFTFSKQHFITIATT